jgi:hypothetical protein
MATKHRAISQIRRKRIALHRHEMKEGARRVSPNSLSTRVEWNKIWALISTLRSEVGSANAANLLRELADDVEKLPESDYSDDSD